MKKKMNTKKFLSTSNKRRKKTISRPTLFLSFTANRVSFDQQHHQQAQHTKIKREQQWTLSRT